MEIRERFEALKERLVAVVAEQLDVLEIPDEAWPPDSHFYQRLKTSIERDVALKGWLLHLDVFVPDKHMPELE